MRTTQVLALLLPAAASATPLLNPKALDALFCKANDIVIHVLNKDAAATAYCRSVLSIPASTSTIVQTTVTNIVVPTTTTETVVENEIVAITETATLTATQTAVITRRVISTTIISCNDFKPKRAIAQAKKPAAIPPDWAVSRISKACSCLSIPTASPVTVLTTTTLPVQTITTYTAETENGYEIVYKTNRFTNIDTVTTTATEVTTSTVTQNSVQTVITC